MNDTTIKNNSVSLSGEKMSFLLQKKTKEAIEANGDIINLQKTCDKLKADVLMWKSKSDGLAKKCIHLARLLKKYMAENKGDSTGNDWVSQRADHNYSITTNQVLERTKRKSQDSIESPDQKKMKESSRELEPNNVENKGDVDSPEIILKDDTNVTITIPYLPDRVLNSDQPKPSLNVNKTEKGLEVHWDFSQKICHDEIKAYELYAVDCSEVSPTWKRVGLINSIKLPIKVTVSDFKSGRAYYFAVRALRLDGTPGPYSDIQNISLQ